MFEFRDQIDRDNFLISVFSAIASVIIGVFLGVGLSSDITKYQDKPYCETQTVAGKEIKRCLIAVEWKEEK